jgi:hypothetical protein
MAVLKRQLECVAEQCLPLRRNLQQKTLDEELDARLCRA